MNRTRFVGRVSIAVLMLLAGAPSARAVWDGAQPRESSEKARQIDLRPKFVKGQEIRFKMTMRSRGMGGTLDGKDEGAETSQEMVLKLKVKETNAETGSTLEMVYEQLKVHMGEIDFDSTKPAKSDDPVSELFRPIVDLKMNVQMDANGNISSVTAGDGGGGVGDLLAQQFTGADVIKGLFGPITTRESKDGRAAVGETWKTDDVMQGGLGAMRLAMTHTLESVNRGRAIIKTKGRVVLEGSEGAPVGFKIKDSVIKGTTEWDTETGMLTHMTQDNRIEVETSDDKGGPAKSKTHSMTVEVTRLR